MTITRLEEWIAPRALRILAVVTALILLAGTAAFFVRQEDIQRIERLERTVHCQDSRECRAFVRQMILDILRSQKQPSKQSGGVVAGSGNSPSGQPSPGQPGGKRGVKPQKGGRGPQAPPKSPSPSPPSTPPAVPAPTPPTPSPPGNGPPPDVLPPGLDRVCELPLPRLPIVC